MTTDSSIAPSPVNNIPFVIPLGGISLTTVGLLANVNDGPPWQSNSRMKAILVSGSTLSTTLWIQVRYCVPSSQLAGC